MKIKTYNAIRMALKTEKERQGLEYSDIAKKLKVSRSTVEKWFIGTDGRQMSFENLLKVCKLYGWSFELKNKK